MSILAVSIEKRRKRSASASSHALTLSGSYTSCDDVVLQQVKDKLENQYYEERKSFTAYSLQTDAECLMNAASLMKDEKYLKSLLELSKRESSEWTSEKEDLENTFIHSLEYESAAKRVEARFERIASLPVTLYLTEIECSLSVNLFGRAIAGKVASLMRAKYGPLHAALKVGNIYLEWGESHLVIPQVIEPEDETVEHVLKSTKFAAPLHRRGTFYSAAQEHKETVRETIQLGEKKMNFAKQMEVVTELGQHRERIVQKLAEVIAKYNAIRYYDVLHRNCQHFVKDCLEALEIPQSDRPQFSGEVQKQFTKLKRGGTICKKLGQRRFRTHTELDDYYKTKKENLSTDELDYILTLYYKIHLRSLKAEEHVRAAKGEMCEYWKCRESECQMNVVLEQLSELEKRDLRFLNEDAADEATTAF